MKPVTSNRPATGFTLIEVMMTVAVIGILAAVAMPSYTKSVLKTQRSLAKGVLMEEAQLLERLYTTTNSYVVPAPPTPVGSAVSPKGSSAANARYTITVASDANTFTLTATPTTAQDKDECGILTLKNTGAQGAVKAGAPVAGCW
ncbi:MAG TPA: type IV pilin protein [Telluria sp.]|jgi:type IV pilus assembly protein PilE